MPKRPAQPSKTAYITKRANGKVTLHYWSVRYETWRAVKSQWEVTADEKKNMNKAELALLDTLPYVTIC